MKKEITTSSDYLVYFHPLTIVSNIFMKNGTYPLMFIGRVYNSMRNGTYPFMFIGRVYNKYTGCTGLPVASNNPRPNWYIWFWIQSIFLLDWSLYKC